MNQARPRLVQVERRPGEVRTPGEPVSGVRRLLVVRNDRLGDLVLTLPAVAALRGAYPGVWLGLAVKPLAAPLARCVRGVDEVVEDAGTAEAFAGKIRAFAPDLLVSVAPGGRTGWCAWRARVPHRIGPGYRVYSPLFDRSVDEHRSSGERHEVELALSYAHRAGAPGGPETFPIVTPDDARETARSWRQEHGLGERFVVLHPGSGGSCPGWPAGHFAKLGELLMGEGVSVVFSVGPADETASRALDGASRAVRRAPRFGGDLPSLAAMLESATVVAGSSTGPLHLAAALGTAAVALHAPWPTCGPGRWGPYAPNGWAIVSHLDDATTWSRSERARLGGELLAAVPPAAVLGVVLALLEGRPPRIE